MNFRTCSSDIPSDCSATELAGCTELYNPRSRNRFSDRVSLGTRDCSHPPGFERLVDGLSVFCGDRDFLVLLAELFVNKSDSVISGRQALDLVLARFIGDCEERILHDADVHLHPWMLVA